MKTRNAAFTMVQKDTVMLELWLKYYSKWFDKLSVLGIAGGTPEGLGLLKQKYQFEFEDLGNLVNGFLPSDEFDLAKSALLFVKAKQVQLLKTHRWVVYSNMDEYIVADPRFWNNLRELMQKEKKMLVYGEGYSVLQDDNEPAIDFAKPFLQQRHCWSKLTTYNKPLLSQKPLPWTEGCHNLNGEEYLEGELSKAIKNTGLYLLHLNYADLKPAGKRNLGPFIVEREARELKDLIQNKELIPYKLRGAF